MILRPATSADLFEITRIQGASPEASQWDPAGYFAYECVLAEEDGMTLGFLVIRQTAADEYEILNLAVDPSARRRGVARQLLSFELAQRHGTCFLEVRESNSGAIQLYEVLGFQRAGRREDYYRDPAESGIVMKLNS